MKKLISIMLVMGILLSTMVFNVNTLAASEKVNDIYTPVDISASCNGIGYLSEQTAGTIENPAAPDYFIAKNGDNVSDPRAFSLESINALIGNDGYLYASGVPYKVVDKDNEKSIIASGYRKYTTIPGGYYKSVKILCATSNKNVGNNSLYYYIEYGDGTKVNNFSNKFGDAQTNVTLPWVKVTADQEGINESYTLREITITLEPGKKLTKADVKIVREKKEKKLAKLMDEGRYIVGEGGGTKYTFSKHHGTLESIIKNGEEQLASELQLTVWRALMDSDTIDKPGIWGNPYNNNFNEESWSIHNIFNKVYSCEIVDGKVKVCASLAGVGRIPFLRYTVEYSVYEDGELKVMVNGKVIEDIEYLPRIGFEFKIPKKNNKFKYFGMGPEENYCDLKWHAMIGLYESRAEDEYVNYVMPQEHGNHIGTKYLNFENGLNIYSDSEFEFKVSEYSLEAVQKARHTDELEKDDFINVRIDYKMSGSGSKVAKLLEKYQVNDKEFTFRFSIK